MKPILFLIVCILSFSANSLAQASETFDIATFQPPKGWNKEAGKDSIRFSIEEKTSGAYCLIILFKSLPGPGNSKENFQSAWQTLVKGVVNVSAAPQMLPSNNPEDWALEGGFAPFENDGEKGVALLYTVSGYGTMMNALILTNTDKYEPQITAFLESFSFKKPEGGKQANANSENRQPQTADSPSGSQPLLTRHFWKQSQNRKDIGGYAGYSSNTYQFNSNGTYTFSRVDFQNHTPKYYLENETGTYKITGNTITITPKKASFSSHKSNKDDPPSKSGNLGLTVLQYSFEFMDLHNNGRLSLLLSPVDGNETKRDGPFSFWLNGEKRNTYSYNAVNTAGELVP